ncbi:MAG: glycosyltransferase family 39 protein, partial [Deltaproteobacteria bacterium]|nr:glycosyltransferase family 39 protein [Deltaproteobacteria bacterium]
LVPLRDEGEYLLLADTLLRDGKFGVVPTSYRMPLYPLLLAAVQGVTGSTVPAYLVMNAFLGTAAVALIYFLCRRVANERAARLSLLLSVPNPFLMANAGDVLTENLFVPLVLAFLLLVTVAESGEGHSRSRWAMAGIFLGLCNLSRPTLLRFGLLLPLFYLFLEKGAGRKVRGALLAFAVSIVLLLPWVFRNYAAFGHFIPGATSEGFVWLGCYNDMAFHRPEYYGSWVNYETNIAPVPYRGQSEYEREKVAAAMARKYAVDHLAEIPRTLPWKIFRTFLWYPHVLDRIRLPEGLRLLPSAWGFLFSFVLVYPLLAWEGWNRRRDRRFAAPAFLCAYFLFVVLATYGSRRMRLPVEGVMIVVAAAGWDRLMERFRSIAR